MRKLFALTIEYRQAAGRLVTVSLKQERGRMLLNFGKVKKYIRPAGFFPTRRVGKPCILEWLIFDVELFGLLAFGILRKFISLQTLRSPSNRSPKRNVADKLLKK